ncbi:MAG TPA: nuclear transport factor 2 family protein [Longimicrobiaceae bacterium]|nr:nuclear transport factor 2 family protein [Longimicrobiaceae bacterium]
MRAVARLVAPVVLFIAAAAAPAAAQPAPVRAGTDWSVVQRQYSQSMLHEHNAMVREWLQRWEAGDAKATARSYAEGAVVMFGTAEKVQGRPAIERWLQRRVPELAGVLTVLTDFRASGGLAYAFGTYYARPRADDSASPATGTYMAVLVEDRGGWKFQSQVFLPDAPPATASAGTGDGGTQRAP